MKIALLLETDGPGGTETMVQDLALGLLDRGLSVVPVLPNRKVGWLHDRFEQLGLPPVEFSLRSGRDLFAPLRLARLLRELEVDVAHSHEFTMGVVGTAAARLLRIPVVITMHGGEYFAGAGRRRWALRWAVGAATAIAAVSPESARTTEEILGVSPGTVRVVPNGRRFTVGCRKRGRAALGLGEETHVILSVGSLYPVKGHDVLIRAFARLAGSGARSDLILAVAGQEVGRGREFMALADTLGVASQVLFLGHREDVSDILAGADLFVLPSRSEGLPLALLEAMAAGKPIVASAVGGIPSVSRHQHEALLVPPDNVGALAGALHEVLSDPTGSLEMGVRARARALELYTAEAMTNRYIDLYHEEGTEGEPPVQE